MKKKWLNWMSLSISFCLLFTITSNAKISSDTSEIDSNVLYEITSKQTPVTDGLKYENNLFLTEAGWMDMYMLEMDLSNPNIALHVLEKVNTRASLGLNALNEVPTVVAGMYPSKDDRESEILCYNMVEMTDIDLTVLKDELIGGEWILVDGQATQTENLLLAQKGQRTVIGLTNDGKSLVAVLVDCNEKSIGATHDEMVSILVRYGIKDAFYLNGQMSLAVRPLGHINKNITNSPVVTNDPIISRGIAFVTKAPAGTLSKMELEVFQKNVQSMTPVKVEPLGYDEYYNPVIIPVNELVWGNYGITGTWSKNVFTPQTAGQGKLLCYYNGLSASIDINSTSQYIDLDVFPEVLQLKTGETKSFEVLATDINGNQTLITPSFAEWQIEDPTLGYFDSEGFHALKEGTSKVTLKIGKREFSAYVVVNDQVSIASLGAIKPFAKKPADDPLMTTMPVQGDFVLSIFGNSKINNLLDGLVMRSANSKMENSDVVIYAGGYESNKLKVGKETLFWDNRFAIKDYNNVRIVMLASNGGNLFTNDITQWTEIEKVLSETKQNNIIIIANASPIIEGSFINDFEKRQLHNILSTYKQKTGKTLFYINASGTSIDVNIRDGIRYIDINGLNVSMSEDGKINLNSSYCTLDFYITGHSIRYSISNVYPKIVVSSIK